MKDYLSTTAALAALCGLFLSGCATGSESNQPGSDESAPVTETLTQGTGAGQEDSSQQDPAADPSASCATADLDVTTGNVQGAAGSILVDVSFANASAHPCTLDGFPGVSLVGAGNGTQLGAPALREDVAGQPVTLAPGESAHSPLRISRAENYDAQACGLVPADGLRIYPPNQSESVFLPLESVSACEKEDVELVSVQPVTR